MVAAEELIQKWARPGNQASGRAMAMLRDRCEAELKDRVCVILVTQDVLGNCICILVNKV